MTPDHLDDDALSATLDGEATAAESAHVEGCVPCRARLDELRAAANAIGTPVGAVDPERRERAVATALAAMPTALEGRRRRQPPAWLLAAAAAVVAIAVLVPVLGRGGDEDANTASKSAAPAQDSAGGSSESSATLFAAPFAPVEAGDLGAVADGAALRKTVTDALRASNERSTTTAPAAAGATGASCLDTITASEVLGGLRLQGRAEVDGVHAEVLVFDLAGEASELRAFAVDPAGCRVLVAETFPAP